ncbi:MAG: RNA 2',3'-cyclic phosphodiesterase [Clostridiaceae bacterium]
MRLFISVNIEEKLKETLLEKIEVLRGNSRKGRFPLHENLHITLVFIGETDEVDAVKHAMDPVSAQQFLMEFGHIDKFRRREGDIYFLGLKRNRVLFSIYEQLAKALKEKGFSMEERGFTPHLTLGRNVLLKDDFDIQEYSKGIADMKLVMMVDKISLMKSERIEGKLTYTEIYNVPLRDGEILYKKG